MAQRCQFTPGAGGSVQDASAGDHPATRRSTENKDKPQIRTQNTLLDQIIRRDGTTPAHAPPIDAAH